MYQNGKTQPIESLVDRIADAVVDRLMQSPYNDVLMRHPPHSEQYYRQHLRPMNNPFDPTPYHYPEDREISSEDALGRFHKDQYPGESSRRFIRPPKPAHLRGRRIRDLDGLSSLGMPPATMPASPKGAPMAPSNSQASAQRRPSSSAVGSWLKTSEIHGQFEPACSYSEVDTILQEPSTPAEGHAAAGSDETWDHPDTWTGETPAPTGMPRNRL
ncbi:Reticulocyte-binding 2 like a [Fusarium albosuccineum]|uniref:Reticulocyte-binding 2 like a n=1 Tax=Fusarium albosuccineum TaxID=1237068 RepID=A0A8H4P8F2_9HYPO|nr:Reticulocyte-binding 2 like a [Fusarium albosuccineum]